MQNKRMIFNNLGNLHQMLEEVYLAENHYQQLAELAKSTGHRPMLSTAYTGLADAYLGNGDHSRARDNANEALRVAQEMGQIVELAASYRVHGDICLAQGDAQQAKQWFDKSIPVLEALQDDEELTKARNGLEMIQKKLGFAAKGRKDVNDG